MSAALDVAWQSMRREGLRLPSSAPFYPLWDAQSRGVTVVPYCRSRAFNVAVADASICLGVRTSVHKFQHVFFLLYVRNVC